MVLQPNLIPWCTLTPSCCVPNFRTIRKWNFMTTLVVWQKEEKQNKKNETQPIFEGSYLRNTWRDLVEIWNGRWWRWPAFPSQKSVGFIEVLQSYICVKIALLFFLLITHGCGMPASWAARYATMCFDLFKNSTAAFLEAFWVDLKLWFYITNTAP